VTAAAESEPPPALRAQLREGGGALVCPVRGPGGEHLMCFRGERADAVVPVRFVPLVSEEPS
jgi:protein-L-isoaspartate O-methyltransferase